MRPQIISPPNSPKAVGPYSHAIRIDNLLFTSGQIPLDADGKMAGDNIQTQTRQVLQNIQAILADQGLTARNVVKTTVFMVDLGAFGQMNEIYGEFFAAHHPARSTVQVAALPKGAQIEIEIIASYPVSSSTHEMEKK